MVISTIVGALAVSALMGLGAWRFIKSVENLQANPAKLGRRLILLAVLYCFGMVAAITDVLQGKAPAISLLGLPIGLYFVWFYLRSAASLKSPPK